MRIIPFIFILFCSNLSFAQVSLSLDTILMGSSFTFTAVASDKFIANNSLQAGLSEVQRIEAIISSWQPDSETSSINKNAGIRPVKVSEELFELIRRSKKISELSNGYFDISFAAMNDLWDFSKESVTKPYDEAIGRALSKVDYQKIILNRDESTVFLKEKGMRIGFGAIGKGFAANRAKMIMMEAGAEGGVVNAGGDLISWGAKPDGSPWNVGIQNPKVDNDVLMWIPSTNQAIVTSGNYEKYVDIDGVRYCHILNPKTGWPVVNMKSVTIICPDAELADALSTTVFVLGRIDGMDFINQLTGVEGIIIDENDDVYFSANIDSNYPRYEK
ncbi:MAG: FAD:protein FMN transferase [Crocinitomicaceae bacterium]|nr:FAD:protein FMN transferase [Flavobacteriales bacterium]NQZ37239.1 FAD:protein FMN transferase [Crocinitomicaceae bacterium]